MHGLGNCGLKRFWRVALAIRGFTLNMLTEAACKDECFTTMQERVGGFKTVGTGCTSKHGPEGFCFSLCKSQPLHQTRSRSKVSSRSPAPIMPRRLQSSLWLPWSSSQSSATSRTQMKLYMWHQQSNFIDILGKSSPIQKQGPITKDSNYPI